MLAGGAFLFGCGGNEDDNNAAIATGLYSGTVERSDSDMRAVIQKLLSFNNPPLETVSLQVARTLPSVADAVRGVLTDRGQSVTPEPVASVVNRTVPGPASNLAVRVYTPSGTGPFPVTVYFHGGGWVIATIDTYDSSCRALCNAAKTVVVSVEYCKGLENRFPAAHEDAYAATQYVINNAAEFGGVASKVAVAGERKPRHRGLCSCP